MAIQQVASFKTSDGKLFNSKLDALHHDHRIDLRAWVQTNAVQKNTQALTFDSVLDSLQDASNVDQLQKMITAHRRAVNRHTRQIKKNKKQFTGVELILA